MQSINCFVVECLILPIAENQNDPIWIMQEGEEPQEFQDKIANHQMLVLKNNQIPKGLIPLHAPPIT